MGNVIFFMVCVYGFLALTLPFIIVGSIPFGVIASKIFKLGDIKKIGSGNIGATNVLRSGNKKAALFTLVGDFMKGYIPIAPMLYFFKTTEYSFLYYVAGIIIVLGHIFSVFLNFKGGKGVATGLGVMFAWNPIVASVTLVTWLLIAKLFKISSLSALIAFVLTPAYVILYNLIHKFEIKDSLINGEISEVIYESSLNFLWYFGREGNLIWPYLVLTIIIFFTHRDNIKRLIKGTESTV